MTALPPDDMFTNPARHAMLTRQRRLAVFFGGACKYAADVAPFAAVEVRDAIRMRQLYGLLAPNEVVYMMGARPLEIPELAFQGTLAGLQMMFPEQADMPDSARAGRSPAVEILTLSCEDAAEMVELTEIAFPGYFRIRTCEMGSYYGVRIGRRLVAMAGERMAFDRYKEISGVCTHPEHTGKGYAAVLITQLLVDHRRDGWLSCLHVGAANRRAISLYQQLGFAVSREVEFHRIQRRG